MKSKNELKEINIINRVCYQFDYIINGTRINFSNILLDKKLCKNISVYKILCKTLIGPKPLRIRFNKIDGFIIALDGINKHLILFDYGSFNKICDKIKYLISKKSGATNSIKHNFRKITLDSYNSLPIEKMLTFHNIKTLIKSVFNKNKNKYYYNIFLGKGLYKGK